jgi:3-phenylpropionate/trans-cinnamate dioxygenase ferredoxin reductase subunit
MSGVAVVGASAAGLSVVETLRLEGFDGRITLVGEERELPYDRPPLSKEILAGTWPEERARLCDASTLAGYDVDLRLGTRATGVDPIARKVELADGSAVSYDELVVATGVRPRRLPGSEAISGVHVLRTLADARALRSTLAGGPRLVIVGAGFLGAEVAAVASSAGAQVTMVSDLQAPLSDVLGADLGALLLDVHRQRGVRVLAGTRVREVLAAGGRVRGVRLADGSVLGADVVLIAIGSLPNVEWLAGSGIAVGDGVLCDCNCQAAPGVWAAGDVASWVHRTLGRRLRLEHRTNAAEQGVAVAENILSGEPPKPFAPVPYIWSDQYDLKLQIYGVPRGADSFVIAEGSLEARRFVAFYGRGGVVCATVGVNMARALRDARAVVAAAPPWASVARVALGRGSGRPGRRDRRTAEVSPTRSSSCLSRKSPA